MNTINNLYISERPEVGFVEWVEEERIAVIKSDFKLDNEQDVVLMNNNILYNLVVKRTFDDESNLPQRHNFSSSTFIAVADVTSKEDQRLYS